MSDNRQTAPIRTMTVREFLRGGYNAMGDEPVVVLNGGAVAFVAFPGTTALEVVQPSTNGHGPARPSRPSPTLQTSPHGPRPFTPVPKPSKKGKS